MSMKENGIISSKPDKKGLPVNAKSFKQKPKRPKLKPAIPEHQAPFRKGNK